MARLRITPLEIALLRFDAAAAYGLPAASAPAAVELPVLAYHVALPGRSVLVDAPAYDEADTPQVYRLPGYVAPPPLLAQLGALGIEPQAITDVLITHAHFDHLGALERPGSDPPVPAFPHARTYLGRGDWDPDAFAAMGRQDLLTVEHAGLLELVDGDLDLGDGLSLVAAPGESPGHTLARVQLGDEVAYLAGDLYHHALEFDDPDLDVIWVDREAMHASKQALLERAAREGARVYFSHVRGPHRAVALAQGRRWVGTGDR